MPLPAITPTSLFVMITVLLGILAAVNFFYFYNVPVGTIFTILTALALSLTALVFFDDY
jgi:hypothetical protein